MLAETAQYGGHRVRVMWERPAGIWGVWPIKRLHKPVPVYVFIGYVQGLELPLRIGLRGDGSEPFIIEDPLAYDGKDFHHGPYANASRYDNENHGHTLSELFEMLRRWAIQGREHWDTAERLALDDALENFQDWIWQEHRRDRNMLPGVWAAN